MLALDFQRWGAVIVPSFTFATTANTVADSEGTPVFVDVDLETSTVKSTAVEAAITNWTVGTQPVHLYGHPAPMDQNLGVARRHRIWVFEDAAQTHGAIWQATDRPSSRTNATALALYSSVNLRRVDSILLPANSSGS